MVIHLRLVLIKKDALVGNPMNQRGFLTLELLISMAILTVILLSVTLLSFSSQSLMIDSQNSNDALVKAQAILEEAKNNAKVDFDLVENKTEVDGMFTKNLIVTELDAITKKVSAEITWQDGQKKVDLYNIITNLSDGPGANTCSFVLSGNWNNPQTTTFKLSSLWGSELPLDSNGIYTITGLDAYLGRLYVTVDSSASANVVDKQKDLFVLGLTNPSSPSFLGSVDNDTSTAFGLTNIRISQKYAYTTSATASNGQLQIFDVTFNPPKLIENFQVSTTAGAMSIFYKNGYVYLGLANNSSGPEFFIIDVATPTSPQVVGTAEIGADVTDIYVHKKIAHVATAGATNLEVFNVTIPATLMSPVGSFTSAYPSNGVTNKAQRVFVLDNHVYLSRTQGTNEFYILDATDPTAITEVGKLNLSNATDVNGMAIRNNLAFLATRGSQLQIYDITNPESIIQFHAPISLGNPAQAQDCEGNHIYTASNDASGNGYITVTTAN